MLHQRLFEGQQAWGESYCGAPGYFGLRDVKELLLVFCQEVPHMWWALLVDLIVRVHPVLSKGRPSDGIDRQQPGLDDLQVPIEIVMRGVTLILRVTSILGGGGLLLRFLYYLRH